MAGRSTITRFLDGKRGGVSIQNDEDYERNKMIDSQLNVVYDNLEPWDGMPYTMDNLRFDVKYAEYSRYTRLCALQIGSCLHCFRAGPAGKVCHYCGIPWMFNSISAKAKKGGPHKLDSIELARILDKPLERPHPERVGPTSYPSKEFDDFVLKVRMAARFDTHAVQELERIKGDIHRCTWMSPPEYSQWLNHLNQVEAHFVSTNRFHPTRMLHTCLNQDILERLAGMNGGTTTQTVALQMEGRRENRQYVTDARTGQRYFRGYPGADYSTDSSSEYDDSE